MVNDNSGFRWMKVKNGRLHLAFVELDIQKNDFKNEIIEDYLINGFDNYSEAIKPWRKGLINGLKFALSESSDFWKIKINKLEGPYLDANPTIIGYTVILAFLEKAELVIDKERLEEIEHFVYESWGENAEKIPNFYELNFE